MKTSTITAAIATICIASANAAKPNRKRTAKIHRTARRRTAARVGVQSDEPYDQYLGLSKGKEESKSNNNKRRTQAGPPKEKMSMPKVEATTADAEVMSMATADVAADEAHSSEDGHGHEKDTAEELAEKDDAHTSEDDHDPDHGEDGHSDDGDGEATKALSGGSARAVSASAGMVGLLAFAYNIM